MPSFVVHKPANDLIEITVRPRRARTALKEEVSGAAIGGLVFAIMGGLAGFVARDLLPVSGAQIGLLMITLFGLVFVWVSISALRRHSASYLFRITPERLSVSVRREKGRPWREFEWRRDSIFEVRPGEDGTMHIRLTRQRPCRLLAGRARSEVEAVARAINDAMTAMPAAVLQDHLEPGRLAYETPGEPYEIEIRPTADGVHIVVPVAGDHALQLGFSSYAVALGAVVGVVLGLRLIPWMTFNGSPLSAFCAYIVLMVGMMVVLGWWRGGQPLVITVTAERVYIDHPGLPIRRRNWRRDAVTEVSLLLWRDKNGKVVRHCVGMSVRRSGQMVFGHDREMVELERVVAALRGALGLPPLAGGAASEALARAKRGWL